MKRFSPILPALVLAAIFPGLRLAGAEPHPSLPPPVIPDCLGVNIHFTDPKPGELEMLSAAGFKWVRMDFSWGGTERKKGEYDFSAYDRLVAALDKFGIRAVFILDYGNDLYDGGLPPTSVEARAAFGRWAVAGVRHFSGKGYLWEMWNEPNGGFWKPKADVKQYAALAHATGEALRDAGLLGPKGEAFIGPATSTIDMPFLEACFQAGLLEFWDAVSVHPYRQSAPENVAEEFRALRLLIRKYAPKDKTIPIISGEWGYSDAWQNFTPALQAKFLPRELLTNVANDVALSIWYDWHDDGANPKEAEHHFGIVANEYHAGRDPVFDPKPAYLAMQAMAAQLAGFRFNKEIDLGPGVHPLLFSKDELVRIAFWVNSSGAIGKLKDGQSGRPSHLSIPVSPGSFLAVGNPDALLKYTYDEESYSPSVRIWGLNKAIYQRGVSVLDGAAPNLQLGDSDSAIYFRSVSNTGEVEQPNPVLQIAAAWKRLPLEIVLDPWNPLIFADEARNPLDHPIEITSDGIGRTVQSHQTSAIGHILGPTREESVATRFSLELPKLGGFAQTSHCVSSSPIRLTVLPTSSASLSVRIENPSGEPFQGKLRIVPFQNTVKSAGDGVSVQLFAGQREKIVTLPLAEVPPAYHGANLSMDADGKEGVVTVRTAHASVSMDEGDSAHPIVYGLNAEGDAKVASRQALEVEGPRDQPPFVNGVPFKITYDFAPGWKYLELTRSEIPWSRINGEPDMLGMWIYGDAGGCQPRARFKDKTGQVFQPSGPKIDWRGWRYVTFPMQTTDGSPLVHWGGASDGSIHYPISWESPFLLDNVSRAAAKGEIFISAPTLVY